MGERDAGWPYGRVSANNRRRGRPPDPPMTVLSAPLHATAPCIHLPHLQLLEAPRKCGGSPHLTFEVFLRSSDPWYTLEYPISF